MHLGNTTAAFWNELRVVAQRRTLPPVPRPQSPGGIRESSSPLNPIDSKSSTLNSVPKNPPQLSNEIVWRVTANPSADSTTLRFLTHKRRRKSFVFVEYHRLEFSQPLMCANKCNIV